jgi:hypothetical protein
MKKTLLLLVLLISGVAFAQSANINNYKYVIVPEKFDFLKQANQYNLNNFTKMVFEKYGFKAYYPNEKMPDELALNKCNALFGDLQNNSGMLSTSLTLVIKDCSGKVLFTSEKGKSRLKEYNKAYLEALREASASLASLNYKYVAPTGATAVENNQPVQQSIPVAAATTSNVAASAPLNVDSQLFAQPIANGYQLVDTTPKVVLKMYKTSQPDSYTAQGEGKNGVIFKKGNDWYFEYYQNDKLVSEKLNIKF